MPLEFFKTETWQLYFRMIIRSSGNPKKLFIFAHD